jgi:phage-related protein
MSYFLFNNTDSRDLGLILPHTPFRPSWVQQIDEISIPGRAEIIKNPSGIYSNQQFTIDAVISDSSKINQIYNTLTGEGKLILSTNPNEYMNVRVEPLIPSGVALDMAEIPITFDCYPFAYSINPSVTTIGNTYTEVTNNSSIYSAPIIEIEMNKVASTVFKGDVNMDGRVTVVDASLVLTELNNIAAGHPTFTPEQFAAADMDDDGILTISDAEAIMAKAAELAKGGGQLYPTTPAQTITLYTNGEALVIGMPSEVPLNGFTIYVDCGLYLIYYKDINNQMVNIMNYSSLDLPLLHTGTNYMMITGENIKNNSAKVTINERWL